MSNRQLLEETRSPLYNIEMGRIGYVVVGIVVVGIVILAVLAVLAEPVDDHAFFSSDEPLVIAHQGGEHLRPDNTMLAFQHAVDLGVDVLEMDIHSTRDGVLVVMHDERLDRTTDGSGFIKDMTFAQILELDAASNWPHNEPSGPRPYRGQGVTVPALRELLEAFPDTRMNIEIKQTEPSIVDAFCELIHEYHREETVLVSSFDADTVKAFRGRCPGVATGGTEPEITLFFVLNALGLANVVTPAAEVLQVPEYSGRLHVVTERFIDSAHGRNQDVHVWTVDEPEEMQKLLELGVDGIITNRPDLLLEILGR